MSFKIDAEKKIVRILGYGQFTVNNDTLNEINTIDNNIVKLLENEENDDYVRPEFERQLKLLDTMVEENGVVIETKEIVPSDIILPGKGITLEDARKVFKGEGIIKNLD